MLLLKGYHLTTNLLLQHWHGHYSKHSFQLLFCCFYFFTGHCIAVEGLSSHATILVIIYQTKLFATTETDQYAIKQLYWTSNLRGTCRHLVTYSHCDNFTLANRCALICEFARSLLLHSAIYVFTICLKTAFCCILCHRRAKLRRSQSRLHCWVTQPLLLSAHMPIPRFSARFSAASSRL